MDAEEGAVRRPAARLVTAGARRLSTSLLLLALALVGAGAILLVATLSVPLPPEDYGFRGFTGAFAVAYAVVGWIVAGRQPRNAVGWIFLAAGLVTAVIGAGGQPPTR